ncbi:hypothetical protein EYC80_005608 [Monilinia laxa]|uniref:BZIP domain-containing protein n=1 Tax=Monilinia laxa TaxID=61186 RepID=A0A5N6KEV6_MONLA|nr:hypothetical protein EYC80_005608 [Monilinia laxa]
MASQLQFIEPAGKKLTTTSISKSVSSEQYGSTRSIAAGLCSLRDQNSERQNRRHSLNLASASPLPQNQRVAAIIQSTGHSTSTSAFINRFTSSQLLQNQHQHLFASAPGSSATLQQPQRSRPQVPLFSQSTGSVPRTPNMVIQDMDLFDEFTAFEGGASTQTPYSSVFSSPAVPTMYDPPNNMSSSSSINMGTVSPKDLFLRDSLASAPNSAAYTNLTTPSTFNESPAFEHYDDSPYVPDDGLIDPVQGDPWFSLFPEESNVQQPHLDQSPLIVEEELDLSEQREVAGQLAQKVYNGRKPASSTSPLSAHSGIRKRDKALPPIIVDDPNDIPAMKRARNTLAARKSRQRKMQKMEDLEDQLAKALQERDHWKAIALRRGGGP